jgi:predicted transcriptional regulator
MTDDLGKTAILTLTARIVAAHAGHNAVAFSELPQLIADIHRSLANAGVAGQPPIDAEPAVPVKKSITPGYLICLEDGRKLKMLKRHLKAAFDLTPAEYRQRWHLPDDYPMTAPNYSLRRSDLAKHIGLGTQRTRQRDTKTRFSDPSG